METSTYIVTEKAGPRVAGRLVEPGERIDLTEEQARFELLAGSIRLAPVDEAAAEPLQQPETPSGAEAKDPIPVADTPAARKAKK